MRVECAQDSVELQNDSGGAGPDDDDYGDDDDDDDDEESSKDNVLCMSCYDGYCSDGDDIILCDSCDISVHQSCYGVPNVPSGEWLCSPCSAGLSTDELVCELCFKNGGALNKCCGPGSKDRWVHTTCGSWISEAMRVDTDPVTFDISRVPKDRFKLKCSLCKMTGCCVQCTKSSCYTAAHPLCICSGSSSHGWSRDPLRCPKDVENASFVDDDQAVVETPDSVTVQYRSSQDFNPLLHRLAAFSLSHPKRLFIETLSLTNKFSDGFVDQIGSEFIKFFALNATCRPQRLLAPPLVRKFWASIVAFPRTYSNLCSLIYADEPVIDHNPFEYDDLDESSRLRMYNLTIIEYSKRFKCSPPSDIWPAEASGNSSLELSELTLRMMLDSSKENFKDIKLRFPSNSSITLHDMVNSVVKEMGAESQSVWHLSYVNMMSLEQNVVDPTHSVERICKDLLQRGYKSTNMQVLCRRNSLP
jgi:hypothetical protein